MICDSHKLEYNIEQDFTEQFEIVVSETDKIARGKTNLLIQLYSNL